MGGQNLHPLQIQTAFAGLLSAALALAIYLALKIWPLRALTRIVKRLDESQESLREKILAKELALLKA